MCQKEENGVVWHIKTVTDEAYKNIILPMSELKEITLRKRGITIVPLRKNNTNDGSEKLYWMSFMTRNALGILRYIF